MFSVKCAREGVAFPKSAIFTNIGYGGGVTEGEEGREDSREAATEVTSDELDVCVRSDRAIWLRRECPPAGCRCAGESFDVISSESETFLSGAHFPETAPAQVIAVTDLDDALPKDAGGVDETSDMLAIELETELG